MFLFFSIGFSHSIYYTILIIIYDFRKKAILIKGLDQNLESLMFLRFRFWIYENNILQFRFIDSIVL